MGPRTPLGCGRGWELAGLTARHAGPVISKDSQTSGPALSLLWGAAPVPGAAGGTLTPLCASLGGHGGPVWQRTEAQRGHHPGGREALGSTTSLSQGSGLSCKLRSLLGPGKAPQGAPRGAAWAAGEKGAGGCKESLRRPWSSCPCGLTSVWTPTCSHLSEQHRTPGRSEQAGAPD